MTDENSPSSDEGGECRIGIHMQVTPGCLTSRRIIHAIETALNGREVTELSIAFVDDPSMARLHRDFMNDPAPTDVITFDLRDDVTNDAIEGEIVVSVDTARRQALAFERPFEEEILRYVIHGALHLTGMDDRTEAQAQAMRHEEDRILHACEAAKIRSEQGGEG